MDHVNWHRIHERELDGVDEGDAWEQEEEEVGRQEGGKDGGEEEGRSQNGSLNECTRH